MNIVCAICCEILVSTDDVFNTPCGHIFHFTCLNRWIERSKTCPQCRDKVLPRQIQRLYFNIANNASISEDDTCTLLDKIDKLNLEIRVLQNDVKFHAETKEKLEKETEEKKEKQIKLKKEIIRVEKEVREKNTAICALKTQIEYLQKQNSQIEDNIIKIQQLEQDIKTYKDIQMLIGNSMEYIDEGMLQSCNTSTLITYISVMKREMTNCLKKRRDLRDKIKKLEYQLSKSVAKSVLSEEILKKEKIEQNLITCESEKILLENKLRELEKKSTVTSKEIPSRNRPCCSCEHNVKRTDINGQNRDAKSPITKSERMDSPYLPVKSIGVCSLKQDMTTKRTALKLSSSILTKKPRVEKISADLKKIEANRIAYDGFGGHSKFQFS